MKNRKIIAILMILFLTIAMLPTQRTQAASITVNSNADNTTADDDLCTLREAINNANSDTDTTNGDCFSGSGVDTITFAADYTITLTDQLPDITTEIIITGNGAANTIIQASTCNPAVNPPPSSCTHNYRIFNVTNAGNLTINDLAIQHGSVGNLGDNGGGINNAGTLTVNNSSILKNFADHSAGGGIHNLGTATITNSLISANAGGETLGAGIYNNGTLTVTGSTFSDNWQYSGGNAGGIFNASQGSLNVSDSLFQDNFGEYSGGGVENYGTASITNVTFTGNYTFTNAFDWRGGAINNANGTLTLRDSTLSNNRSDKGGGIYNGATLTVENSTISGNTGNTGGGIYIDNGTLTLTNSTLSGNTANNGGGIGLELGNATATHSTIASNTAGWGGGIYVNDTDYSTRFTLKNTIVSDNTGDDCAQQEPDLINANSYNFDSDGTCRDATQHTTAEINLGTLADNGGSTQTIALNYGSVAINTGDTGECLAIDQRGVTRPQGAGCDVGAYEVDASYPEVTTTSLVSSYSQNGPSTFTVTFNENVSNLGGGSDANDAENPNNYILVEEGSVTDFQTTACNNTDFTQDTRLTVNSVSYDSSTYTSTLNVESGGEGSYRLFICGTTSIIDLANNRLNGGDLDYTFDFTVQATTTTTTTASSLPATGFRHGRVTVLPHQPAAKAYASTAMTLEIPKLGASMPIVGVPQSSSSWDVTWLGNSAGYLSGSAFPTWAGNTVITGHVWDAYNQPGPFAELKSLEYGDQVQIQAWGETYTYEVRESKLLTKKNVNAAFQSEQYDWVTLVTCEFYNPFSGEYLFRRAVRAVLVSVK